MCRRFIYYLFVLTEKTRQNNLLSYHIFLYYFLTTRTLYYYINFLHFFGTIKNKKKEGASLKTN